MRKLLLSGAVIASSLFAGAVAPAPWPVTYTQPDGSTLQVNIKGNEYGHVYYNAENGQAMLPDASGRLSAASSLQVAAVQQQAMAATASSRGEGLHATYTPHSGSPNVLVLLVQFKDVKFALSDPKTYYNNFLNAENFTTDGNAGSVRSYFKEQSSGKYTPNFKVHGVVTLGSNRSSYSSTGSNAYKMVTEAAKSLDSEINFADYDLDGDGYVDNVYVIYAGQGANFGASNAPWPHNSECPTGTLNKTTVDGKTLNHYACTCEIGYNSSTDGIGTFIHEFGHVLGLPDFYNTNTQGQDTPVFWSVMDRGSFLGYCKTPCGYSAYERHAMDWLEYRTLGDAANVNLRSLNEYNFAVKIETGRSGDYYVLENRQNIGFDCGLYGNGMLIWHIDASDLSALTGTPNNDSSHLRVKLVRADNDDSGDSVWGDIWPGSSNKTSFTGSTTPAMVKWNASTGSATTAVNLPVTNIKNTGGLVTFSYRGGSYDNIVDPVEAIYTVSVATTLGGKAYINGTTGLTNYSGELNKQVTLNAVAESGYKFEGWKFNGQIVSTEANYTISLSTSSAGVYTASFVSNQKPMVITVEAGTEGGTVCINGNNAITTLDVYVGQRVTITAVPASGYELEGWYYEDERISKYNSTEITVTTENGGTYVAKFNKKATTTNPTITVVATEGGIAYMDGNKSKTTSTSYTGAVSRLYAEANDGYKFVNWTFKGEVVSTQATFDVTFKQANSGTYTANFAPDTRKNYAHFEGNSTYTETRRGVKTMTVSDNHGNTLTVNGAGTGNGVAIYTDLTDNEFVTEPGSTIIVSGTSDNTSWMHSYVYIDFDNDGRFDVDVNNVDVNGDLVAHTGYCLDKHADKEDTADPTVMSDGSAVNNGNYWEIPSFVLPENMADGTYRLRYKNDWNSTDPFGRCAYTLTGYQSGNYINECGGAIIDITIKVVTAAGINEINGDSTDAPAVYYNLMGYPVASDNLVPGIYILRQGDKTSKVFVGK